MSVRIGHASGTEKGTARNGEAGDQTGKEVCTREWYNKSWKYVLRANDAETAEYMARACEKGCANKNIGYDQNQRNTAHTQAKTVCYDLSKIAVPCETDCSAFMTLCAIAAGVKELEYSENAPTTSTMKNKFENTGKFIVLSDSKYLTNDNYLKRGDILVAPGKHTVMVLSNGSRTEEKSQNERYEIYTVQKGDTLSGIAKKYLGNASRYKEIMQLNGLTSTVIRIGQKLKIKSN